jgi:hypothetical protein
VKRQLTELEEIFASCPADRGLISINTILNTKRTNNPILIMNSLKRSIND